MVGNVSIFTYKKCQHFLSFPLYVNDVSHVYFTSTWALLVFMNKTILITDKKKREQCFILGTPYLVNHL